ncbi:MAG: hypothetical protein ABJD66_05490 [Cellulophaga sp.]|uniref:hypothetical protein n=1 Tax=Cellulophaga sp. TaxID=1972202 RepID=UPI00326336A8
MKKISIIIICIFSIYSCQKEELTTNDFKGAYFENWDEFHKYHLELEFLPDEISALESVLEKDYKSFLEIALNSDDDKILEIENKLTYGLMAILNSDLQFKIGEKIITFKEDAFYKFDTRKNSFIKVDNVDVSIIEFENSGESSKIYISGTNTGGYSKKDFWRNAYYRCSDNAKILGPSNRQMRYTQQLKSLRSGSTAALFIETKLFYRNSKNKLRFAKKEEKNYTYNIQGTVGIAVAPYWNHYETQINYQNTTRCTKSKYNRQLLAEVFPTDGRSWHIDLTGTITHHINGDSESNKWIAPVNWK